MLLLLMPMAFAQVGVHPYDSNYYNVELRQREDVCISGSKVHDYCESGEQVTTCECKFGQWDCTDKDYLCAELVKPEPEMCAGCQLADRCMPYGLQFMHEAKSVYCGALGVKAQKAHNVECTANYECLSNKCDTRCVGPVEQINPVDLVIRFFSWLGDFLQVK